MKKPHRITYQTPLGKTKSNITIEAGSFSEAVGEFERDFPGVVVLSI